MNLVPNKQNTWWLDPFQEVETLQKEMNRLFYFSPVKSPEGDGQLLENYFKPAVDIYDNQNEIVVKADIPGLNKEEINVSVDDNILSIQGDKKYDKEVKRESFYRFERCYGKFIRSIELPKNVDSQKIAANYQNGVLEVKLPIKEEAQPKQIKVDVK
ncbi:MAG: Hsp20/alpha crystallin family protein [Candidatus Omnitrophica bacterium]|nr:Hsp20/alpha crystallin family protein [Candidatus Omnitrophota bacterium]